MRGPRMALILIAFLAFISLGLPDGVLGVAWPSVAATFRIPLSHLGILLAASTCGYLVSSFNSGGVVRRMGVGRTLLLSSALMSCAATGYALAPLWPAMALVGLFAGVGSGAIDAALNAYAARHFSPRLVNWLHAFYGVGATLGPLLMTAVLSSGNSWRWGYGIIAAVLGLMSLCFLLTLRLWETRPGETTVPDPPHTVGAFATLARPVVMLSVVLFFLYTGIEVAVGQWTYTLFTLARDVDPVVAGVWIGVYWGSLTVGRIVFGTVAAHARPLVLLRGAMLVAPLGAMLIWLNVSPLASFLGLALMGFCFAPIFPLLISLTPARVGRSAAHEVIGFQVGAACLGAAGVPGFAGLLTRWTRNLEVIPPVLLTVAVVMLLVHEIVVRVARKTIADVA